MVSRNICRITDIPSRARMRVPTQEQQISTSDFESLAFIKNPKQTNRGMEIIPLFTLDYLIEIACSAFLAIPGI